LPGGKDKRDDGLVRVLQVVVIAGIASSSKSKLTGNALLQNDQCGGIIAGRQVLKQPAGDVFSKTGARSLKIKAVCY